MVNTSNNNKIQEHGAIDSSKTIRATPKLEAWVTYT
jgi:hypothetical protein